MTELVLLKTPTGALVPADPSTAEAMQKLKMGTGMRGEFTKVRNIAFHRKAFALFKFAFDMWDAPAREYQGHPVQKTFDRFRKDLTILAGHFTETINFKGEVRLEAKSLSFGNMSEDEFSRVYADVLNVVWDRILKHKGFKDTDAVNAAIEELLRFE